MTMQHTYPLTPLRNGFVDFHDNGTPPPRGKTRFGLVVDLNRSRERLNINFEAMSDADFITLLDSENISPADKAVLLRAADTYVENGGADAPNCYIAHAKRNVQSGQRDAQGHPRYKLVPDYSVCAILVDNGEDDPDALIFWGNETHALASERWYVPSTANSTIKARCDV